MTDLLRDITMDRDRQELSLGDVLDVKAGLLLALIAVLATISGTLLADSQLGKPYVLAQMVSILLIAIGALCSVFVLLPRDYSLSGAPGDYKTYLDRVKLYFPDNPDEGQRYAADGIAQMAAQRVDTNHGINAIKSRWLSRAFWPVLVALMIDIGTLVCVAVSKILS